MKRLILAVVVILAGCGEDATSPDNTDPVASFTVTPESGFTGTSFAFDAALSSDVEDSVSALVIRWDWDGDGTWDTDFTADKNAVRQFATRGTRTVVLEVKDTGGKTGTAGKPVPVHLSASSPEDAADFLVQSYRDRDPDLYADLLGSDFIFRLQPDDAVELGEDHWTRAQDLEATRGLLNSDQIGEILIDVTHGPAVPAGIPYLPEDAMLVRLTDFQLDLKDVDGSTYRAAHDVEDLFFRPGTGTDEDSLGWYLLEWRDVPSPSPHDTVTMDPVVGLHLIPPVASCAGITPRSCSDAKDMVSGQLSTPYFAVLTAWSGDATNGVKGVAFGITYDGAPASGVDVQSWTLCSDGLEYPINLPQSGGGNAVTWGSCIQQEPEGPGTGVAAVAGYFYLTAYSPDVLRVTEYPVLSGPRLSIVDCHVQETILDVETQAGSVAFSNDGNTPGTLDCHPVSQMSWGRIKSLFR